ncbi:hypothetical protein BGZ61DRAFT_124368 [Ilyonectria robusta]|uniref:uncharacterized protein n=1 Tax=Ilyonectria robusta TaxID=1079257 RepID=UPI001E8DB71C|nr:uncharacterized protein BGZ61DRAFT_124368 [Ilyonectria robusta]KAH8734418.1 hypothetical protein BGZ61DRAFT_124368 [Ilyonectria robusta]
MAAEGAGDDPLGIGPAVGESQRWLRNSCREGRVVEEWIPPCACVCRCLQYLSVCAVRCLVFVGMLRKGVVGVGNHPSPIARTGTGNHLSGDWMRPGSGLSIHLTRRPRPTVSMTRGRARSMRCCPRWFLVPSPSHVVDPSIGAAAGGGGSFRGV